MGIKDPFSYSGRWDSVGLDCSNCANFVAPLKWPDSKKTIFCYFHKVYLDIELGKNGYKNGEWFCKDFENLNALPKAVEEFQNVIKLLSPRRLYKACKNDELMEYDMNILRKV